MHLPQLWLYPVTSCRGLQQPMLPLVAGGLFGDRRWMIVGDQYQFLTQRQLPNMVKIFAVLEEGELRLRFNDQLLSVPAPSADKLIEVTVWQATWSNLPATWKSIQVEKHCGGPTGKLRC